MVLMPTLSSMRSPWPTGVARNSRATGWRMPPAMRCTVKSKVWWLTTCPVRRTNRFPETRAMLPCNWPAERSSLLFPMPAACPFGFGTECRTRCGTTPETSFHRATPFGCVSEARQTAKPAVTSFFRWAKRVSREPPSSASGHGAKSWFPGTIPSSMFFLTAIPKLRFRLNSQSNHRASGTWVANCPSRVDSTRSPGSNLRYPAKMPNDCTPSPA